MNQEDLVLVLRLVTEYQARQRAMAIAASNEAKLLVLRLVAGQARLHGNYAAVRPARPSNRPQVRGCILRTFGRAHQRNICCLPRLSNQHP